MKTVSIPDLVAPPVRGLQPYVPGKPIAELEREYGVHDIVKLASNENPLGPGPRARAAMAGALAEIGLYPDGNGFELKRQLSAHHGIEPECLTLGNGSNDRELAEQMRAMLFRDLSDRGAGFRCNGPHRASAAGR